jgi:hypothetical protein
MKRMLVVVTVLLLLGFVFTCADEKKPNDLDAGPGYYFPKNLFYKWTYVPLGTNCVPGEDSFVVSVASKSTRDVLGARRSGWDLVSSAASGATTFVYQVGDTIFTRDLNAPANHASYNVLVGPIKPGTFWRDTFRDYEYSILGFEDVASPVAGGTYARCAKVKRISRGDPRVNYFWWGPQIGKVKWAEVNQSGLCQKGDELRRLDKHPDFP